MQRFQIEDLVVQDSSGVVFRAFDTETSQTVAVRRFFPFGANGGGLQDEEQTAYKIAVERLAAISHPALRAVICGGCDPVDGMPFIATEWIEGPRLRTFIERGPLTPAQATTLLGQALEVCELLSEVLAEEAVWVETDLESIVVGAEGSGRGITFWISPLKWLGKHDSQRGLESIITLTEELMHWRGKLVSDQAGNGLGSWLKWLRSKARTTTLHEAREMLAASIGSEPPVPAKNLVRQATRPVVVSKKKKKPSRAPILIAAVVVLAAVGAGGWELKRRYQVMQEIISSDELTTDSAIPEIARIPVVPASYESPSEPSPDEMDAKAAKLKADISERGGVFKPADHDLLVAQEKQTVVVEGVFEAIGYSSSKKTMYLQFSKNAPSPEIRGSVLVKDAPQDLSESMLAPLRGKKIRLRGEVKVERFTNPDRPVIVIANRSAIQEVK